MIKRYKYNIVSQVCIGIFLLLLGFVLRYLCMDYIFGDYHYFLSVWVKEIKEGGFSSLKDPFYNYTPLYMYMLAGLSKLEMYSLYSIKLLSFFFEYVLAFFVAKIACLNIIEKNKKTKTFWVIFLIVPLIPTLILNSGIMSQCDVIYTTFVFASIYFLFTRKQILSMVLLGIAFSLKLQMFIILPFFFIYMLRGHIKWYMFCIIPLVYLGSILPAWIVGRPFLDLLFIYSNQAGSNPLLTSFFPSIYVFIDSFFNGHKMPGILFVAILVIAGGLILKQKKYSFTFEVWIKLILLSIITCSFFLPGMHERYMFMGDIAAILYVAVDRRKILASIGVIFISFYAIARCLYAYLHFPFSNYSLPIFSFLRLIPWKVVALFYIVLIAYVFYDFVKTLNKAKELNLEK